MTGPAAGIPPTGFIYPVVKPAPIETALIMFLTPLFQPTPVSTRLPIDTSPNDTQNGFIRVEAAGGPKINLTQYNQTCLLHVYVPDEFEVQGEQIAQDVTAYVSAVGGQTIYGFQIVQVPRSTAPQRRTDPRVNLLRYMSTVTWTVAGQPVSS